MANYKEIMKNFPTAKIMSPDRQLILFGYKLAQVNYCIDNIDVLMGMYLYLQQGDRKKYKQEWKMLDALYNWVVDGQPIK